MADTPGARCTKERNRIIRWGKRIVCLGRFFSPPPFSVI
jgi:hypothetical protein